MSKGVNSYFSCVGICVSFKDHCRRINSLSGCFTGRSSCCENNGCCYVLNMGRIIFTCERSFSSAVILCPAPAGQLIIMSEGVDILYRLGLNRKGWISEGRRVSRLSLVFTSCRLGYFRSRRNCLGLRMCFVMSADMSRGDGAVILRPDITCFIPVMSKSVYNSMCTANFCMTNRTVNNFIIATLCRTFGCNFVFTNSLTRIMCNYWGGLCLYLLSKCRIIKSSCKSPDSFCGK